MKKSNSTKKALCLSIVSLCLCVAMLSGTTFAWFTDTVKSENNIIQTGNLDVAMYWAEGGKDVPAVGDAAWTDASEGPMFNHGNWEPGYAQARHILIANEGTLALNYKLRIVANGVVSKLADVIDVYYFEKAEKLDDVNVEKWIGTLVDVLGTEHNLSKKVFGSLTAGTTRDLTLVLKMRETANDDYQNIDLGCTFSVELIATQMASESDSFGNNYDENGIVPDADFPAAMVRPLEDLKIKTNLGELTLNAGYKFQPTLGRPEDAPLIEPGDGHLPYDPEYSVENSAYRYWHADFVVKSDREVPANSIVLAGYYSFFCDNFNSGNWVPMTSDQPVAANTEIRLVEALAAMSGWNITVNYNDLCLYGNDGKGFMCGLAAIDPVALAGTTITVELRMYETYTEEEAIEKFGDKSTNYEKFKYEANPEDYVHTIGTITYTFPAAEVKSPEELTAALEGGAADVKVAAGTYTFPKDPSKLTADTTLYCEEGTVFEGNSKLNINGATVVGATFSNPTGTAVDQTINGTFKDCTFTGANGLRWCYAGETVVFENCVFDGSTYGVHFDGGANEVLFKNCTFSGFNAMPGAVKLLTMEGCTFVANDRSPYNGINLWGNTEMKNCTFVFDGTATEWVDLCNSNQTVTFTNCVVTNGNVTKELKDVVGNYGDNNTIIIDGVTVDIPNMP